MVERITYSPIARTLAVVSGVITACLCLAGLAINPLGGLLVSSILILLWGIFLKLIAFMFEPTHFATLKEPETSPDIPELVQAAMASSRSSSSRILADSSQGLKASNRVLGQTDPNAPEPTEDWEEERAWAEMFRAL
jgi:hypothetical protein